MFLHLSKRLIGSIFARSLTADETAWVRSYLSEAEFNEWNNHNREDKFHTYRVAQRVVPLSTEYDWVIAAALLHDIGKLDSNLSTFLRVLATLLMAMFGKKKVVSWQGKSGWQHRFARYGLHGPVGGERLANLGSRSEVCTWASEHQQPSSRWNLPIEPASALADADRA